ncbi:MAG: hypothetical protein KDB14_14250 [Planctomycetales bacterium]|nr:hypothetical protein [Planctomycetales bacterium]
MDSMKLAIVVLFVGVCIYELSSSPASTVESGPVEVSYVRSDDEALARRIAEFLNSASIYGETQRSGFALRYENGRYQLRLVPLREVNQDAIGMLGVFSRLVNDACSPDDPLDFVVVRGAEHTVIPATRPLGKLLVLGKDMLCHQGLTDEEASEVAESLREVHAFKNQGDIYAIEKREDRYVLFFPVLGNFSDEERAKLGESLVRDLSLYQQRVFHGAGVEIHACRTDFVPFDGAAWRVAGMSPRLPRVEREHLVLGYDESLSPQVAQALVDRALPTPFNVIAEVRRAGETDKFNVTVWTNPFREGFGDPYAKVLARDLLSELSDDGEIRVAVCDAEGKELHVAEATEGYGQLWVHGKNRLFYPAGLDESMLTSLQEVLERTGLFAEENSAMFRIVDRGDQFAAQLIMLPEAGADIDPSFREAMAEELRPVFGDTPIVVEFVDFELNQVEVAR